jgi:hypothetical protein
MSYVPVDWTAQVDLSGYNMNRMGTMYASALAEIDVHTHDAAYYTKALADARYFQGSTLKPDADKIDGKHWNEIVGNLMPIGAVVGWNDTEERIPDGWHIADGGTYSGIETPDFRARFPIGAGNLYTAGVAYGRETVADAGGSATVGDHTLTITEIPNHYHDFIDHYNTGGTNYWMGDTWIDGSMYTTTSRTATTGYNHDAADEAHNHGTKSITLNSFYIVPPFLAKYIIIKVS